MARTIEDIEGIGPAFGEKLRAEGIRTPDALLEAGGTPSGRTKLAEKTGVPESQILKWVNMADLFRIKGVAGQYAELLERAGVDTVRELRNRKPENLVEKLAQVNAEARVCKYPPSLGPVRDWIEQARSLPPRVQY